ncbi:hypothetical protein LMG27952_01972 [Paraburkholderia hiiakae]|uniref:Uncharacterized protein n=1 Tax=Paraburkholderia hiiakae TaxID=1081782 RepID=A0ABN7HN78_9BURK|nr:hypothetical protein LMG27952_01972 [Paraburkholderia hiiakae]
MPSFEHGCDRQSPLGPLLFARILPLVPASDGPLLGRRVAATPDALLRFLEVRTDGVERVARPCTQRHFARLALEAVTVVEVQTDALGFPDRTDALAGFQFEPGPTS